MPAKMQIILNMHTLRRQLTLHWLSKIYIIQNIFSKLRM